MPQAQNIDNVIDEVRIDQPTSNKTGKPYTCLTIVLTNGYELTNIFRNSTEMKIIEMLLEGAK